MMAVWGLADKYEYYYKHITSKFDDFSRISMATALTQGHFSAIQKIAGVLTRPSAPYCQLDWLLIINMDFPKTLMRFHDSISTITINNGAVAPLCLCFGSGYDL